jgi:thioredoxin 1|tara:strand:+ start:230 stop:481 length:252 start_codon:yes stop_codon:yes gene_type:complete
MNKLIYISAPWCGPCKMFGPVMAKIAESGIPVQKLDADKDQSSVMKYGVRSIPTVVKVDASGNMIDKFVGVKSLGEIKSFYNG